MNNGTAGILLIIKIMLSNSGKISDQIFKKLTYLKKFYVNQLFYGFISSTKHSGWPSDGQAFISDDLGSGTLGVLYVLTLMADGGNQSGNHFFF